MDGDVFRAARERIDHICRDIEALIAKKAVRDIKTKLEEAESLMSDLREGAEGDVQEWAVRRRDEILETSRMKVDAILDRRDAGKKGDGNIAFKCTWNDRGFKAPCSDEAYRFNRREGRAFCSLPTCRCREYPDDVGLAEPVRQLRNTTLNRFRVLF